MSLRDNLTLHRLFVQRLAAGQTEDIKGMLASLKKQAIALYDSKNIMGKGVRNELRKAASPITHTMLKELIAVSRYEAKFVTGQYRQFISEDIKNVNDAKLASRAIKESMKVKKVVKKQNSYVINNGSGKSLEAAYTQYAKTKADEIFQVLRDSKVKQLAKADVITALDMLVDGRQLAQASVLSLTAVNHVTNVAKEVLLEANRDLIDKEQWVADLELNNCPVCSSLNDEIRPAGEFEQPPLHWGCNCEVIPYVGN